MAVVYDECVGHSAKIYLGRDVLSGEMVEGYFRGQKRVFHQFSEEWAVGNCWRWLGDE